MWLNECQVLTTGSAGPPLGKNSKQVGREVGGSLHHSPRKEESESSKCSPYCSKSAFNCASSVGLLDETKGTVHISIRERLPNMLILVSVFGNPSLFRPHPLRTHKHWVINGLAINPRVTESGPLVLRSCSFLWQDPGSLTHRFLPFVETETKISMEWLKCFQSR